jgi:hypothetical protein
LFHVPINGNLPLLLALSCLFPMTLLEAVPRALQGLSYLIPPAPERPRLGRLGQNSMPHDAARGSRQVVIEWSGRQPPPS